jgi:hypothetical protein
MPVDFYRIGPSACASTICSGRSSTCRPATGCSLCSGRITRWTRGPYRRARQWLFERPWRRTLSLLGTARQRLGLPLTPRILQADVRAARYALHAGYEPGGIHTPTVFFNPTGTPSDAAATWRPYFRGPLVVHDTPDPHDDASVDAARTIVLQHLNDVDD